VILDDEQWRIVNFYHDVWDNSSLQALLALEIDAITPTMVIGDFNTHSPTWSPPDTPRSHWASRIEEWAASNLLTLANNPGKVTRKGADHERDSTIDLAWFNEAAIQAATFTGLEVDWEGNLGLDHAMLRLLGCPHNTAVAQPIETDPGFVIDPGKKAEWLQSFRIHSAPTLLPTVPTATEVEKAVEQLVQDIQKTNEDTFRKRRPLHPKASPWWNAACATAVQNLRDARGADARATAQARLKGTVKAAK